MYYIVCKKLKGEELLSLAFWSGDGYTADPSKAKVYEKSGFADPRKGRDHAGTAFEDCRALCKRAFPEGHQHPIVVDMKWIQRRTKHAPAKRVKS